MISTDEGNTQLKCSLARKGGNLIIKYMGNAEKIESEVKSGFKMLNKLPREKRSLITAVGTRVIPTAEKYKKRY